MKLIPKDDDINYVVEEKADVWKIIQELCQHGPHDNPFYIMSLDDLVFKFNLWMSKMPRVKPHYAVKCNDTSIVLATLAALGCGFDCASKMEIAKVLDLGVHPDRIIFANPTKPSSHIRHAAKENVQTMTFDSEIELSKIKLYYPDAKLVLRIRCDAERSQCPLGKKFGCDPFTEAPSIIEAAQRMGLDVIGISFHVGSGCSDYPIYYKAIKIARDLFDFALTLGYEFKLLDIGGGFPGDNNKIYQIDEVAQYVNSAIDEFFPKDCGVEIISEPGRFFVASAYTLVTNIHSKKAVISEVTGKTHMMYYINDGVYGSFNCQLYDHQKCVPLLLKDQVKKAKKLTYPSIIWGPTCDALDQITNEIELPNMNIGDYVVFENMGAYTMCCASAFNGFPVPTSHVYVGQSTLEMLEPLLPADSPYLSLIAESIKQRGKQQQA
ncbi:ornithine decarboxylase 1-like [Culicoides brevitarsis]|uniref:ornithine decarboxylase 1-like n=1 Tax=Culicoides brevitarsis TaxID=469753 RepID=UPI00307BC53D